MSFLNLFGPSFVSPVPRPNKVSSGWGADRSYRGRGSEHEGLDFPVAIGTPIFAADGGVVVTSKNAAPDPAGEMISIQHPSGIVSRYMHLQKRLVAVGARVSAGQEIAKSGNTGIKSSGPHLHFDLKVKPDKLSIYTGPFGKPAGGFPPERFGMIGIPAEPFIPVDSYAESVRKAAAQNAVPLYQGGLGLGGLALLGGVTYYLFFHKPRRA